MVKKIVLALLLAAAVASGWMYYATSKISQVTEESQVPTQEEVTVPEDVAEIDAPESKVYGIEGAWQSAEDAKSVVVYREDGVIEDYYDGEMMSEGTWIQSVKDYDTAGLPEDFLHTTVDGESYEYAVLEVTAMTLTLSYTERGNMLVYKRLEVFPEEGSGSSGVVRYESSEYQFKLEHPSHWEMQEALKPQEPKALHEIVFWESEYDMWRASFRVQIFDNAEKLAVSEWWGKWLADEDTKKEECVAEYGEGNAPCLFLRGLVENEEKVTFAGTDAVSVELFRFDHTEECTYVAHGEYVYGLCAAGSNPNDVLAEEHLKITNTMRQSFIFN